jgi:hypothetical protein
MMEDPTESEDAEMEDGGDDEENDEISKEFVYYN